MAEESAKKKGRPGCNYLRVGRHERDLEQGKSKWDHPYLDIIRKAANKPEFPGELEDEEERRKLLRRRGAIGGVVKSVEEAERRRRRGGGAANTPLNLADVAVMAKEIQEDKSDETRKTLRQERLIKKKGESKHLLPLEKKWWTFMIENADPQTPDSEECRELVRYALNDPRIQNEEEKVSVAKSVLKALRPLAYKDFSRKEKRNWKELEQEVISTVNKPLYKSTVRHIAKKFGFKHEYLHEYDDPTKRRPKGFHRGSLLSRGELIGDVDFDREQFMVMRGFDDASVQPGDEIYQYRNHPVFTPDTPFDEEMGWNARNAKVLPKDNMPMKEFKEFTRWQRKHYWDSRENMPDRDTGSLQRSQLEVPLDTRLERNWFIWTKANCHPRDCYTREAAEFVFYAIAETPAKLKLPVGMAVLAALRQRHTDTLDDDRKEQLRKNEKYVVEQCIATEAANIQEGWFDPHTDPKEIQQRYQFPPGPGPN